MNERHILMLFIHITKSLSGKIMLICNLISTIYEYHLICMSLNPNEGIKFFFPACQCLEQNIHMISITILAEKENQWQKSISKRYYIVSIVWKLRH